MKAIRSIEVVIRQCIWAIVTSAKATTYDKVKYKGEIFYIKSPLSGEGVWNLHRKGENEPSHVYINERDFKIVHSIKRTFVVIKDKLMFQKTSWGAIDKRRPIGRRLCYNTSEDIKF